MNEHELREADLLACARYVDDEFDAVQRDQFEQRMAAEPALRAHVEELQGMRGMFRAEPAPAVQPSLGFQARVLDEIRRLPTGEQLASVDRAGGIEFESYCRKFLVAAALIIGIGVLVFAGLLRQADSGELEATPEAIRAEMEQLDSRITDQIREENLRDR